MKKLITLLSLVLFTLGCSLDVKKANAPTDPPKLAKNAFNAQQLEGRYEQGGRPVMFTWPDEKFDEASNSFMPMTFDEKVQVRADITRLSDDKAKYEAEFAEKEPQIIAKYKKLGFDLDREYKEEKKCYTLCEPDGEFFCLPNDPEGTFPQVAWKTPESEEEKAVIERCQVIETEIESLGDMETAEINAVKEPATKANNDLLAVVGTNFFDELTEFGFEYGPMGTCSKDTKICALVQFVFEDVGGKQYIFSNSPEVEANFKIMDAKMDRETGILTFSMPAVDFSESFPQVYGKIEFNLELNPGIGKMKVAGDILVKDFFTEEETIGRFDSSGSFKAL